MFLLCRLIPLSVVIYTVAGGLKATFTSSYLHTVRTCLCVKLSRHSCCKSHMRRNCTTPAVALTSPFPACPVWKGLSIAHRIRFQSRRPCSREGCMRFGRTMA